MQAKSVRKYNPAIVIFQYHDVSDKSQIPSFQLNLKYFEHYEIVSTFLY